MNTLTVPADVWAHRVDGMPFVAAIVEGERYCTFDDAPHTYPDPVRWSCCEHRPPAWLVALRDARCECVDAGTPGWIGPPEDLTPCPRCVDGRLLHDVRVECDGCGGSCGPEQWALARKCCPDCGCSPTRCPVDVVPVVGGPNDPPHWPESDVVSVWAWTNTTGDQGAVDLNRHVGPQRWDNLTLTPAHVDALAAACGKPPADWPGMYAVLLTEVES